MPIDIVYTWVDGADAQWRLRRDAALHGLGHALVEPPVNDRFSDNDELRFSLRSIERFAPWVNKVFIVTDRQVPPWLNRDHAKVSVIDHSEIFEDANCLPTFSCRPIEANLHRIPGLSEQFVYFNDDFFLGRSTSERNFFVHGQPRIFTGSRLSGLQKDFLNVRSAADNSHRHGLVNTRRSVLDETGIAVKFNIRHFPQPCTKSLWSDIASTYRDALSRTMRSRFRSPDDVLPTYLFALHALATHRGRRTRVNLLGPSPTMKERLFRLRGDPDGIMINLSDPAYPALLERLRTSEPTFFCLNQVKDTPARAVAHMKEILMQKFPVASAFETTR